MKLSFSLSITACAALLFGALSPLFAQEAASGPSTIVTVEPKANGSPYCSLSDLLKKWPAHSPDERREVVMITDGIDRYNGLRYDPSNPYLEATIRDALRNHVVVYAIYFHNAGFADRTDAGINS